MDKGQKYPDLFTRDWWLLRREVVATIAREQKRSGIKWTQEQIEKSKQDEYVALYGREASADELYAMQSAA
ncbi:MAG: hypothetical protein KGL39_43100 [Patescibacteria group bacterium]|nr:hypothetical protein [Patescibacteria group bacterium]